MREIKFKVWSNKSNHFMPINEDSDYLISPSEAGLILIDNGDSIDSNDLVWLQYIGLKDKNGKEIYEGDVLKSCFIETEYQTHIGDNIPNGSYTEPCGVISKWNIGVVRYNAPSFTTSKTDEDEDLNCPISGVFFRYYDKDNLHEICYANYGAKRVDDNELWEDGVGQIIDELKINPKDFNEFFEMINGYEVIGNIYENPEILELKNGEK